MLSSWYQQINLTLMVLLVLTSTATAQEPKLAVPEGEIHKLAKLGDAAKLSDRLTVRLKSIRKEGLQFMNSRGAESFTSVKYLICEVELQNNDESKGLRYRPYKTSEVVGFDELGNFYESLAYQPSSSIDWQFPSRSIIYPGEPFSLWLTLEPPLRAAKTFTIQLAAEPFGLTKPVAIQFPTALIKTEPVK